MVDPLTLAIATAAAGKAVELTGQPVKDGVVALVRKVRGRFRGRPADDDALNGAIADPQDVARLAETLRREMEDEPSFADELEAALRRAMDEDSGFRTEVENRLHQTRVEATSKDNGVTNVFNGNAEKVIQLGDLHGGLTIN